MKKPILLLMILAICAGPALFFWRGARFDQSGNERFTAGLQTLKHTDTRFTEGVLKARYKLLDNYDEFPELEGELSRLVFDLRSVPEFVDPAGKTAISNSLTGYESILLRRAEMLEAFKSQNAVLNNSLAYFPAAGEELLHRVDIKSEGRELAKDVNELLRGVLALSLNLTPDAGQVEKSIAAVRNWQNQHPKDEAAPAVLNLLAHAQAILTRTVIVDGLAREIVSLPASEKLDEVSNIHQRNLSRALSESVFYRVLLYLLCGILAACVAWTVAALRRSNRNLERRVRERTDELVQKSETLRAEMVERQRIQSQLLQTSRLAGMAEVATGVLHNVGNVLNSINVSASLVADRLRKSKAGNVAKAAAMLRANDANLAEFLTQDPKGRQLPAYLEQLAEHLKAEQELVVSEVNALTKNVDHVKDIVATQQSYAKVSGVKETVKVADLVEDALRMNASALVRHDIRFVREYGDHLPEITVEKHKVLQILVNLIRNAKHACDASSPQEKLLMLRVTNGDDRVRITFTDNGVGIPLENLSRIFNHGFTTKKDGHGFGLHSGALAAKEMGGCLTAHSEGPGKGATFTLELPVQPEEVGA